MRRHPVRGMRHEGLVFGSAVVGVAIGLALLLYAEAAGASDTVLLAGGVVLLAGMAILTGGVVLLEEPAEETGGH